MQIKNDTQNYGIVEKILHGSIALLMLIMLSGGFFLDDLPKPLKPTFTNLHKLTGLVILLLAILFVVWKRFNKKPPFPSTMPRWQHFLAHFVHHMLLLAAIVMPLAGWIMSTASQKAPHIGGLVLNFPGIPESKYLSGLGWTIHSTVAWVLIALISLHVLGALKHALIDKDNLHKRMWF